ncbi:cytidylate kinase [Mycoplasmopsis californica]|uniref:Cytidylate kinase n=1 Tax=Mycoplasmopsis equigenitalium TaxID=114883 RepID=A0ABY5J1V4_9BACT|nr:(d)CMP kinase [Mycoplasmopsis equigenitalium]UUD37204.1 (d)CMP kinase [Mycoplasmopsis equigenitalium]VEU69492.1 cytidylate kinase [Mycoplasmopsis californica]
MGKINIAIDGPSGVGKSTISKHISENLGYNFINSGSVYRAVALYLYLKKIDYKNQELVIQNLPNIKIELEKDRVFLNGKEVENQLREQHISQIASVSSSYPKVREFVVRLIQNIVKNKKGYIMDGRDTTFRLMPNAELKIFLWADASERAKRRLLQDKEMGFVSNYDEVLKNIIARDEQDMNREVDPLHQTKDAIKIDCTNLNKAQVIEVITELVRSKESENK